jgi:hypothetical protein
VAGRSLVRLPALGLKAHAGEVEAQWVRLWSVDEEPRRSAEFESAVFLGCEN